MSGPARYPYQRDGARWLAPRRRALLADQQGLGKTVQAIDAADLVGAEDILVLCKAIARVNWAREFEKWSVRQRPLQVVASARVTLEPAGVLILNYDLVHRASILRQLVKRRWDLLIVDEMQMLKAGDESRRGTAVLNRERGLHRTAERVWGLSGTPAPNHAGDLFAWLAALHPEALSAVGVRDYHGFISRYTLFEETPFGYRMKGNNPARLPELRRLLADIRLRRLRNDVLPDLPPLAVDSLVLRSAELSDMRAVQTHPDAERIRDIASSLDPERADIAAAMRAAEIDGAGLRRLTGLVKLEAVAEQVRAELEQGEPAIVVMAYHRDFIQLLAQELQDFDPVLVHGGLSAAEKQKSVDRFQHPATSCRVFIGQIESAGTSITLTAASRMLIAEASWVPGDNEQAILRILRIGQDRPCRVSFVGLADSFDEVVARVYAKKARAIAEFLD